MADLFLCDLHNHTIYCDGKAPAEAMVKEAVRKGINTLGFSAHSYVPFDAEYTINPDQVANYIAEIKNLREKYSDKIEIVCGIEQDILSGETQSGFDYSIGSVHCLKKENAVFPIDLNPDDVKKAVRSLYNGNLDSFAEDYYESLSKVIKITKADIIGHFDLITKFSENCEYLRFDSKAYKTAAFTAAEELLKTDAIFEINTGAISRGYRSSPYPSKDILSFIAEKGGKIVFSSDAHSPAAIGAYFNMAANIAITAGFKSYYVIQNGKWCEKKLI